MTTHAVSGVDPTPFGDTMIEDLITRAADLKAELVAFTQSPQFARLLDAQLDNAADHRGYLDESMAVLAVDHFALQYRLPGGRTIVERFVSLRQPRLSDDERAMVLGWRDVVEGCFEFRRFQGDAVELHNLTDDLVYRVYSNMGHAVFTSLREGMFVMGRIVPVHPATDAWLVSGHLVTFPKSERRTIAEIVAKQVIAHPELLRRNPALLRRGWEVQSEHRAKFIAQVGSDLVVLPPDEAQATFCEHYRRLRGKAVAGLEGEAAMGAATTGPAPEDLSRLPDDLMDADSIALIYDELEGLCFYRDFDRLDALFADPALVRDRTRLTQLREYLDDESVSPLAIRRLVERHPGGADEVFRTLLRKPAFSWSKDGEKLLRRHKKSFFDCEPMPSISIVGERLAELLRAAAR